MFYISNLSPPIFNFMIFLNLSFFGFSLLMLLFKKFESFYKCLEILLSHIEKLELEFKEPVVMRRGSLK